LKEVKEEANDLEQTGEEAALGDSAYRMRKVGLVRLNVVAFDLLSSYCAGLTTLCLLLRWERGKPVQFVGKI
jgi:hypothetical protein